MIVALCAGREAPSELRDRIALDESGARRTLRLASDALDELVILSTCHRTELYAVTSGSAADAAHALAMLLPGLQQKDQQELRFIEQSEAVEHLFRVACGLDALVVGESQVLGQVRRAFVLAQQEGRAKSLLSTIFSRALRLGRRVRNETPLGSLGLSIGSIVAAELAARYNGIEGRVAAVLGAGEAAGDAAWALTEKGARVSIVARSMQPAHELARRVHGTAHGLDQLSEVFSRADFAVLAVNGGPIISANHLPAERATGPFTIVDLSVPSAIESFDHPNVSVLRLKDVRGPSGSHVTAAIEAAEAMIEAELIVMESRLQGASGAEIRLLRARAEMLALEEARKAAATLGLQTSEAEHLATMAVRLARKLLHPPTAALSDGDEATRATLARVFNLNGTLAEEPR